MEARLALRLAQLLLRVIVQRLELLMPQSEISTRMKSSASSKSGGQARQLSPLLSFVAKVLAGERANDNSLPLLGYGTGNSEQTLEQLQQNLIQELGSRARQLVSESARVLLVGPSAQVLAKGFAAPGQELWLVHESFAESGMQSDISANKLTVLATDFLQAELAGGFDLLVIEGTVSYLDQLTVLQKVRSLLADSGKLLLLGEFLADDSRIEHSELANLSSFCQLSERLGFALHSNVDFSAGARLSLKKFMQRLNKFPESESANANAADLRQSLEFMASEFDEGRRVLVLEELQFNPDSGQTYLDIDYSGPGSFQPAEIEKLFEDSFNTHFDAAVWSWKYELGRGRCVIAREQESRNILCHYGGAPRQINYFGEPAVAIQVCDVMALPEVRRHYGHGSLFFKTAATFLEREIGNTVGHLLGFGFPNQKAMNIAKRLGLYEKTDDFVELVFTPSTADTGQIVQFDPQEHGEALDELWSTMAADFPGAIVGLRDSDYFQYRYLDHPNYARGHYHCLGLAGGQGLDAVAVLKKHEDNYLLLDLICGKAAMANSIRRIQAWAHEQDDQAGLKFWLTKGQLGAMNGLDYAVNELGIEIPCNSWNPGPPSAKLYGHWWLTAGDMDFQ